jgi:hypothetical protein
MRPVLRSTLLLAAMTSITAAAPMTVVLDFRGPHSDSSVVEMEREVEHILRDSGISFQWRSRAEAGSASYDNLILVRFHGKCVLEPVGYLYDERGTFAITHSTGGEVLPFSEVECGKIATSLRSAMVGRDFAHADTLFGRALGRVVAHELVHVLTREDKHGKAGVTVPALTSRSLMADELPLSSAELERLRASQ